jgi:hypothetical protein
LSSADRQATLDAQTPPYEMLAKLFPNGVPWKSWRKSLNVEDFTQWPAHSDQTDIDADAFDAMVALRQDPGKWAKIVEISGSKELRDSVDEYIKRKKK